MKPLISSSFKHIMNDSTGYVIVRGAVSQQQAQDAAGGANPFHLKNKLRGS
jgi:hypothetical protein